MAKLEILIIGSNVLLIRRPKDRVWKFKFCKRCSPCERWGENLPLVLLWRYTCPMKRRLPLAIKTSRSPLILTAKTNSQEKQKRRKDRKEDKRYVFS